MAWGFPLVRGGLAEVHRVGRRPGPALLEAGHPAARGQAVEPSRHAGSAAGPAAGACGGVASARPAPTAVPGGRPAAADHPRRPGTTRRRREGPRVTTAPDRAVKVWLVCTGVGIL